MGESQASVRGLVRVRDRTVVVVEGGQPVDQVQSQILARFRRIVADGTQPVLTEFGTQCVGFSSRSSPPTTETLDGGPIEVRSALGVEQLDSGEGYNRVTPAERRLDRDALISVSGGGDAYDVPDFSVTLDAPDALSVTSPATDGSEPLPIADLEFRWNAGNGELILLEIIPDSTGSVSGGKIQCLFADRGCGVVPQLATTFLRADPTATRFRVVLSRIRDERVSLDGDVTVDVEAISRVEFELALGGGA